MVSSNRGVFGSVTQALRRGAQFSSYNARCTFSSGAAGELATAAAAAAAAHVLVLITRGSRPCICGKNCGLAFQGVRIF